MKTVKEPNTILYWQGKLSKVTIIATGRVIYIKSLDAKKCLTCGYTPEDSALEDSPFFQDNVEPVKTLDL